MIANELKKSIELDHVGPIEHLSIPIPEGGGVICLRGVNGSGKTHALEAVEALYSQSARKGLRASDGVPSGRVEGLGVSIRLGRSNTAKGELVCESLDGRVDPSQLVDPGLKDPLAADSRRLGTLIRLAGIAISGQQWLDQLGLSGANIPLDGLVTGDPVETADRIRRRLHDAALAEERLATSQSTEAAALAKSIADVDLTAESDRQSLADRLTAAIDAASRAMASRDSFADAAAAKAKAMLALDNAKATMIDIGKAVEIESAAANVVSCAEKRVAKAERDLAEAREALSLRQNQFNRLNEELTLYRDDHRRRAEAVESARAQASSIESLRVAVDAQMPVTVSDDELSRLVDSKAAAQAAVEHGETIRRARATKGKADTLAGNAADCERKAKALRATARSTDQVLEQALVDAGFTSIKVHDGRLCVQSDRGLEPFSELSHGERWTMALELASRGLPAGSVLPVCQEAWESLDPSNRAKVCQMAQRIGLVLLTAEASDGELRAEVLGEGGGE